MNTFQKTLIENQKRREADMIKKAIPFANKKLFFLFEGKKFFVTLSRTSSRADYWEFENLKTNGVTVAKFGYAGNFLDGGDAATIQIGEVSFTLRYGRDELKPIHIIDHPELTFRGWDEDEVVCEGHFEWE